MKAINYQGLTVLITGASYGIGAQFARALAAKGAKLILTARSEDKLQALADELSRSSQFPVRIFSKDLSQPAGPKELYDEIKRAGLAVDLLINNAGFGYCGVFDRYSSTDYQAMVDLNVTALMQLTHLFLTDILSRTEKGKKRADDFRGGILNLGSTASFQPLPKMAVYAATKAFVLSFSEALWAEYRNQGIRIFCLCPGNTESQFHALAGIKPRRIFFRATAQALVDCGLYLFAHTDKPSHVFGLRNFILAWGNRFVPRRFALWVTSKIYL